MGFTVAIRSTSTDNLPMQPWNHWYHCMGNTYGTWLPGDPRGFRTRHHREHVDGDYKHPPLPGTYDGLLARSRQLLSRRPISLSLPQRREACIELVAALQRRNIELIVLVVTSIHMHLLARFPAHDPRRLLGLARKESSHYLAARNVVPAGSIWAVRTKCVPIHDRSHQLNVVRYILSHAPIGAVWLHPSIRRA